jgi:ATP-dependent exoDNAse (exonuclease V) beta subunit
MLDAGDIRRELRFNVMLPASLFSGDPALAEALGDSEVLVQGVMDCVFISADGTLTLVDYKTDRIPKGLGADAAASFLLERHRDQLRYYAMALRKIYGRAPDRILLYSLCLGKGIQADLSLSDFSPESRSGY